MTLPVKEKTWLYNVNQTVGNLSGVPADNQDYIFKLKDALTSFATNPWTVWGSSDGTSYDSGGGTDYWMDSGDLIWGTGNHSWIVLKQTAIGTNFAICIDLNKSSNYQIRITMSPTAGYSGGSLSGAPSASDLIVLKDGNGHGGNNVAWTGKLHVWQSSDGECTRWAMMRGGTNYSFAIFDKPKNPVAAWTYPALGHFAGDYISPSFMNYSDLNDNALLNGWITSNFTMYMTCEGWVDGSGGQRLASADQDTGEWPIMPIGLASASAGHRGVRKGALYDLWWGPTALNNGDTFPDNASKQFVVIGDLVLPWNGSVPLMA